MTPQHRHLPWRVLASLVPIATGALGLISGPNDVRAALTPIQSLAAWSAVTYGALGMGLAAGFLLGRPWSRSLTVLWGIPLTLTGGLAPIVWGGATMASGILSALVTASVVGLVAWLGRRAVPFHTDGERA